MPRFISPHCLSPLPLPPHRCDTAEPPDSTRFWGRLPAGTRRRPSDLHFVFLSRSELAAFCGNAFLENFGGLCGFHRGSLVAQDFLPDRPSHSWPPLRGPGTGRPLAAASCGPGSFRGPAQAVTATPARRALPGRGFLDFSCSPLVPSWRSLARDGGEVVTCWWRQWCWPALEAPPRCTQRECTFLSPWNQGDPVAVFGQRDRSRVTRGTAVQSRQSRWAHPAGSRSVSTAGAARWADHATGVHALLPGAEVLGSCTRLPSAVIFLQVR